ncbi:amidohydrolase family protein [Streptomyces sp. P6-2-1]|uniref:amidohydrolase family protein n=1 Tax=unclassified Streptomyces TaxID=2593676 RepID=UPI003D36ADD1
MTADIVDAHHHVWELSARPQPWIKGPELAPLLRDFTLAELEPQARAAGVNTTVVVQTVSREDETAELLALAAGPGPVGAVVGWTDLTAPDAAERVAALRELPGGACLRGLRHQAQDEADPRWLCLPEVRRGLRAVGAAGLVYELLVTPRELPAAVETARALPDVPFVLDHAGKPPLARGAREPWATHLAELAALPHVSCKLSGLLTEAGPARAHPEALRPWSAHVLDTFGPERVLLGSDWPVCTLVAPYTRTLLTTRHLLDGLTPAERAAVLAGNARRVYGIPAPW